MNPKVLVAAAILLAAAGGVWAADEVRVVREVAAKDAGALYPSNRAPLVPSPFVKLPIGAITPRGWLRRQLELEREGMTGRLTELSRWCKFEGNSWADPSGQGHSGWEELPYWLKGYGDLGYVLKDEAIIKEARRWIEPVLASQEPDGWFGPRGLKTSLKGKTDFWPHMLMLNILQSHYEYTGDARVLPFMARYFKWQLAYPDADFIAGYWPKMRMGDNIESLYWLYNRTGEKSLLDLGPKIHRSGANWTDGIPNWHGVNLSQGFREPGVYYMQTGDRKFLEAAGRNYDTITGIYGQFPGGGLAADENCRPGYTDPRQGTETCTWVEFMHSFEMLTKISGHPLWADRCEEIAFNSFPASMTPDLKGLHYLTAANQAVLDSKNHSPGIQNGGCMFGYNPHGYRCCQHNVSHGWPYYAQEMWLATWDRGLCASLYGASEVEAKVGDGTTVRIAEATAYPADETVTLTLSTPKAVRFPLYLRIPRWCQNAKVSVNGKALKAKAEPLSYLVIDRTWADGDKVVLDLPMRLAATVWEKNKGAVSVRRGPLAFSLRIGEKWVRYGGTDAWPAMEVHPTTAWNYGLELDPQNPDASIRVVKKAWPIAGLPFALEAAPVELLAKARKIPEWTLDRHDLVAVLQASPARTEEPVETVTLVPMGWARLRISVFPVVSDSPQAQKWAEAAAAPASSP